MDLTQISRSKSILNEDGSCENKYLSLISDADLIKVIRLIIYNRIFESRMVMLQRQGRLGFTLTSTGEESIIYGSAYCLNTRDPMFLTYRELGAIFWRGVPKELIMNQLIGNSHDLCLGRQMPVHHCYREFGIPSISSPVGTHLTHAAGFAYAAKLKKTGLISLAFLGEGSASGNDFHSALNFAGVWQAPVIFVIRNNGYAISTPESRQTAAESLAIRGEGYGIPGIQIDGNDFLMVVKTVKEAVERARDGRGPTVIEAMTYRAGAHSSSDDPTRYRSEEEMKNWERVDNLNRLILHAKWRTLWTDEKTEVEKNKSEKDITQLIAACEKWPPPKIESLFDDIYEKMPDHLKTQKENYLNFLAKQRKQADA